VLAAKAPGAGAQLADLPQRFTYSDRIIPFPPEASAKLFGQLTQGGLAFQTALFGAFAGEAQSIDQTDGVRAHFAGGGVIHLRGSGNAPELRCYTEAASEAEAVSLNAAAVAAVKQVMGLA
jgi:phosphomannomutase